MPTDLAQIVAEKMKELPIEKQQKVLEFVNSLLEENKKTLYEAIAERVSNLSAETLERLPAEDADYIDHYLHGPPEKTK
jgi:acyl-CoA reductase-like NAD-dependent aldehyde dehydrogenase